MNIDPNDPKYLSNLVQGLQQQRNQANDTIAHLATMHALKDEEIKAMHAHIGELQRQIDGFKQAEGFKQAAKKP